MSKLRKAAVNVIATPIIIYIVATITLLTVWLIALTIMLWEYSINLAIGWFI